MATYTRQTLADRPDTREDFRRLNIAGWPAFLTQGDEDGLDDVWSTVYSTWAEFQFVLLDQEKHVVAAGQTVPFVWNGTVEDLPETIAGLLRRARDEAAAGRKPNTLCALAALVDPARRARGLSTEILKSMRTLGAGHGLAEFVAPVRPTLKASYPLTPMERFIRWRRSDGTLLDPWLRVHERLGAKILGIAPRTLVNVGTVAQWEEWTGLAFPESGEYVVLGAMQPVRIDRDKDEGRYADPNVWMRHPPLGPEDVG